MAKSEMAKQANRLHHLSMLYVGAIAELAEGKNLGPLPMGRPGLKTTRDVLDLMLFVRAEVNALVHIMIEKKIISVEEMQKVITDEYKEMADVKALQFNCESTEVGLVFRKEGT